MVFLISALYRPLHGHRFKFLRNPEKAIVLPFGLGRATLYRPEFRMRKDFFKNGSFIPDSDF
jgi:hypothetical protein